MNLARPWPRMNTLDALGVNLDENDLTRAWPT
jgi:hypothetical protein